MLATLAARLILRCRIVRWVLLLTLLAGVLMLVFAWVAPGLLLTDEVVYHRMTHGLLVGDGLFLDNGYDEMRSVELTMVFSRENAEGRLTAQYPYGLPLLALPFYAVMGLRGMFLVNALAYVVAIWLSYCIACQLLRDRTAALVASCMVVSTYFTEYAFAVWPHASAVAATLGAVTLAITAYQRPSQELRYAAAAGLVAGLGLTLRLDAVFTAIAIAFPFYVSAPTRVRPLLAIAAGLVPGVLVQAVTNHVRWGTWSPLSYGSSSAQLTMFAGFAVGGAVAMVILWLLTRAGSRQWFHARRRLALLASLFALLGVLLVPQGYTALRGIVALVADMRLRDVGNEIGDFRFIVWDGGIKLSLLQSSPFLALAIVSVVRVVRIGWAREAVAFLAVVPVLFIVFYGRAAWHGGLCLNMRYLTPALPFLCILAAGALTTLVRVRRQWLTVLLVPLSWRAYLELMPTTLGWLEPFLLTIPLVIASAVAVLGAVDISHIRLRTLALCVAMIAIGWSVANTIQHAQWSRNRRMRHHVTTARIAAELPRESLLIVDLPDPFYAIVEHVDGVWIAMPHLDRHADLGRLVERQRDRAGGIYASLPGSSWKTLVEHPAFRDNSVRWIDRVGPYVFGELRAK